MAWIHAIPDDILPFENHIGYGDRFRLAFPKPAMGARFPRLNDRGYYEESHRFAFGEVCWIVAPNVGTLQPRAYYVVGAERRGSDNHLVYNLLQGGNKCRQQDVVVVDVHLTFHFSSMVERIVERLTVAEFAETRRLFSLHQKSGGGRKRFLDAVFRRLPDDFYFLVREAPNQPEVVPPAPEDRIDDPAPVAFNIGPEFNAPEQLEIAVDVDLPVAEYQEVNDHPPAPPIEENAIRFEENIGEDRGLAADRNNLLFDHPSDVFNSYGNKLLLCAEMDSLSYGVTQVQLATKRDRGVTLKEMQRIKDHHLAIIWDYAEKQQLFISEQAYYLFCEIVLPRSRAAHVCPLCPWRMVSFPNHKQFKGHFLEFHSLFRSAFVCDHPNCVVKNTHLQHLTRHRERYHQDKSEYRPVREFIHEIISPYLLIYGHHYPLVVQPPGLCASLRNQKLGLLQAGGAHKPLEDNGLPVGAFSVTRYVVGPREEKQLKAWDTTFLNARGHDVLPGPGQTRDPPPPREDDNEGNDEENDDGNDNAESDHDDEGGEDDDDEDTTDSSSEASSSSSDENDDKRKKKKSTPVKRKRPPQRKAPPPPKSKCRSKSRK